MIGLKNCTPTKNKMKYLVSMILYSFYTIKSIERKNFIILLLFQDNFHKIIFVFFRFLFLVQNKPFDYQG